MRLLRRRCGSGGRRRVAGDGQKNSSTPSGPARVADEEALPPAVEKGVRNAPTRFFRFFLSDCSIVACLKTNSKNHEYLRALKLCQNIAGLVKRTSGRRANFWPAGADCCLHGCNNAADN